MPEKKYCLFCDEEIPEKRLIAVPNSRYCLACQWKLERRGKITTTIEESALASCGEDDNSARTEAYGQARPSRIHL